MTIRSQMRSIMDLIRLEMSELFALEFAKIAESHFVYNIASTNVITSHTRSVSFICPEIEKLNFSSLFGIYLHC